MNHKTHITHWRGRSIKEMNREELIEALILEMAAAAIARAVETRLQIIRSNSGQSDYFYS